MKKVLNSVKSNYTQSYSHYPQKTLYSELGVYKQFGIRVVDKCKKLLKKIVQEIKLKSIDY